MVPRGRERKIVHMDQARSYNRMEKVVSDKAKTSFQRIPYSHQKKPDMGGEICEK